MLLAVNHPNSFLDSIILSTIFKNPIHSLARGDAFKNKKTGRFLRSLNMLPVYRISEGAENLQQNYSSFEACREIFKNKGIVLIYSEGRCENEWHLRPLMKGTARLIISAWEEGIDLKILPIGINYHSFSEFGKDVIINFGDYFSKKDISTGHGFGKDVSNINEHLSVALQQLVYEVDKNDEKTLEQIFPPQKNIFVKILLFLPAMAGFILHAPVYLLVKWFTKKRFGATGHYDSVVTGLLFFIYPIYLVLTGILIEVLCSWPWALCVLLFPLLAWSYVQWKRPDYLFSR